MTRKSTSSARPRGPALAVLAGLALVVGLLSAPSANAAGVTHWVDGAAAATGPGTGCGLDAAYPTVTAAVAAATSGDTIEVCPGLYVGNITVTNKTNLTIRGAKAGIPAGPEANPAGRGTDESIIAAGATGAAIGLSGNLAAITIDGLTIRQTFQGPGINANTLNVTPTIVNNILDGAALPLVATSPTAGIVTSGFSNARIAQNSIRGFRQGMILTGQVTNLPSVIEGNRVTEWASGNNGIILGQNSGPGHRISGNTIVSTAGGIGINTPTNQIEISDNTITRVTTGATGIFLTGTAPVSGAQVTGNTIEGYSNGIWQNVNANLPVGSPPAEIHGNNIVGNTTWAINNTANPGVLDIEASCNWFGSNTGPVVHQFSGANRVSVGNVAFTPWLTSPAPATDCLGGLLDPTAEMTVSTNSGDAQLLVDFDGSTSSDLDGTIVSYAWDFGDGGTATGATASYTYLTPGVYVAELTVTDNHGRTGTAHETITVNAPQAAPTASANATPATGPAPLAVVLDATGSSDSDGTIVSYDWDLGDGGVATGAVVNHVYTTPGTFIATVTVTDDDGLTATFDVAIVVNPTPQPQVDNDCKKGGWEAYGFSNQGLCIRYVNTGKDSRIGG
jgi:PKD repeat protein